jgi:secreted Zn-dependent insulinase-like peptidase
MGVGGLTEKEAKMVLKALPTLINNEQSAKPAPPPVKEPPAKKNSYKATSIEEQLKNILVQHVQTIKDLESAKRDLETEVTTLKVTPNLVCHL